MEQKFTKQLFSPTDIVCSKGNKAAFLCSSAQCLQNAFMCSDSKCCNRQDHSKCSIKTTEEFIEAISKSRKNITSNIFQIVQDVLKQYDQIKLRIDEQKLQFNEEIDFLGLDSCSKIVLKSIKNHSIKQIKGKDLHDVFEYAQIQNKPVPQITANFDLTRIYENKIQSLLRKLTFELTDQTKKQEIALTLFQCQDTQPDQICIMQKDWIFIPAEVSMFKGLKNLIINNCAIRFIGNLEHLAELDSLSLDSNQIEKIEGLDNLVNLQGLSLTRNNISKIENLDKLIHLKGLYLSQNPILKIENLDELKQLQMLAIHQCKITKIQGLIHLANLKMISIYENPLFLDNEQNKMLELIKEKGIKINEDP